MVFPDFSQRSGLVKKKSATGNLRTPDEFQTSIPVSQMGEWEGRSRGGDVGESHNDIDLEA